MKLPSLNILGVQDTLYVKVEFVLNTRDDQLAKALNYFILTLKC